MPDEYIHEHMCMETFMSKYVHDNKYKYMIYTDLHDKMHKEPTHVTNTVVIGFTHSPR